MGKYPWDGEDAQRFDVDKIDSRRGAILYVGVVLDGSFGWLA